MTSFESQSNPREESSCQANQAVMLMGTEEPFVTASQAELCSGTT